MSGFTSDGYTWTPADGLQKGGFECKGVVSPAKQIKAPRDFVYDAIVIGAGYAGLSAARDLATAKHSVLMLEGRDRVGGRTYSIEVDGFKYEMGGTWISHYQPYIFAELQRYGLDKALSPVGRGQRGHENDYYSLNIPGVHQRKMSHDEAGEMLVRAWNKFINVDGHLCRQICPLPHQKLGNVMVDRRDVDKLDKLSCWDRYEEIKHTLTTEESAILLSNLLMISGGDLKESSLWDMIMSQALLGHDISKMEDVWFGYKLKAGQSHLAKKMFDESVEVGLDYSFKSPVMSVKDNRFIVEAETESGHTFRARRVISTIPLNVLKHIQFSPPLSDKRRAAIEQGHICFMTKIHAEVKGSALASWQGTAHPNPLLFGLGDGLTPRGNTRVTAFGGEERPHFVPERDIEKIHDAFQALHPMEIQRLVFHNWNTDPFSQAGPGWYRPEYMTKYQEELQNRHGNVFFASADWADGWRAFIDGAIEQGRRKAQEATLELRAMKFRPSI